MKSLEEMPIKDKQLWTQNKFEFFFNMCTLELEPHVRYPRNVRVQNLLECLQCQCRPGFQLCKQ